MKTKDESRITTTEIKFMKTAKTLNCKRIEDMLNYQFLPCTGFSPSNKYNLLYCVCSFSLQVNISFLKKT
jgi:hypothetical protein